MKYKIALQHSDEGFSVSVPGLPGCWSQGATEKEALGNIPSWRSANTWPHETSSSKTSPFVRSMWRPEHTEGRGRQPALVVHRTDVLVGVMSASDTLSSRRRPQYVKTTSRPTIS